MASPDRLGGSLIPRFGRLGGCHVSGRYLTGGKGAVLHGLKIGTLHLLRSTEITLTLVGDLFFEPEPPDTLLLALVSGEIEVSDIILKSI